MNIEKLQDLRDRITGPHDGINAADLTLLYELLPFVDKELQLNESRKKIPLCRCRCGEKPKVQRNFYTDWTWYYKCDCGQKGDYGYADQDAREAWNRKMTE